jgi:hypothetical protein
MKRILIVILIVAVALSVLDSVAYDGRYTSAAWREAKHQGYRFNVEMKRVFDKSRF